VFKHESQVVASLSDFGAAIMRPRHFCAVLFDKDGTLVDFRTSWVAAYAGAAAGLAARAGLPPEFAAELLARTGFDVESGRFLPESPLLWATNEAIGRLWKTQPELRSLEDIEDFVLTHLADEERYPPVPVTDLPALFAQLAGRGLSLGIATMDSTARARGTAIRLGIADYLAFIAGADAGYGEKPEPGMVHGFCAAVGCSPAEVVVVGDTAADLEMARRAGAGLAIAVRTGGTPVEVLERSADHVIEDVGALPALLFATS
jgi:phosphoglycolate phosphatase